MNEKELINYLKKYFLYKQDGTLERTDRRNSNGSKDKDGYVILKIKGRQYKAHRLIFAMFNGRLPKEEIDHINRNRSDNRIENLRECNRSENVMNSTLKTKGIYIDKTKGLKKKYCFKFKGRTFRFYTEKEAIESKLKMGGRINFEYNL